MVMALSTVSFIESFHGVLVCEGTACVTAMSVNVCLLGHGHTSQCPSPLPRVNTVQRHRSYLCRSNIEQHATHSANMHRGLSRGAAPRLNWAACQKQSANRSGNSATHTPSPSWLSVRRAASAPLVSSHVHVWLHWPKLSAVSNTNQG
jgi:hypothetical protein